MGGRTAISTVELDHAPRSWARSLTLSTHGFVALAIVGVGLVVAYALLGADMTARSFRDWQQDMQPFWLAAVVVLVLCTTAFIVVLREAPRARAPHGAEETAAHAGRRLAMTVTLVLITIAMRLVLVPAPPRLSDDVYRYVFEGQATTMGINPYRVAPIDDEAEPVRAVFAALALEQANPEAATQAAMEPGAYPHGLGGVHEASTFDRVNHPHVPAIYQPTAQGVFAGVAWLSPTVMAFKFAFVLFDLVFVACCAWLCHAWFGRAWLALIVGWHPLLVIEIAGSGHLDALPLCLLAIAFVAHERGHARSAVVAVVLAGATKFLPFAILPIMLARTKWRHASLALLVLAALYAPFLAGDPALADIATAIGQGRLDGAVEGVRSLCVIDALRNYSAHFTFNALPVDLAVMGIGNAGAGVDDARLAVRGALVVAYIVVLAIAIRRRWSPLRFGLWASALVLFMSPVFYPWYALWFLPYLLTRFRPAWLYFSGAVLLAYANLPLYHERGQWQAPLWAMLVQYAPLLILLPLPFRPLWRPPPDEGEPAEHDRDNAEPSRDAAAAVEGSA